MNDKRKEYLKKWREDNKEHIKHYKKEYAKTHDSSFKKLQDKYEQLQQENKKQKEIIDRIDKYIKENIYSYYDSKGEKCIEETVFERSANPKELLDILKEVSE